MKQKGFTLVELMITVAIVAVLAAFAVPNYRDYVRRSTLSDAQSVLMQGKTRLDQYFNDRRFYANTSGTTKFDCSSLLPLMSKAPTGATISCPTQTPTTFVLQYSGDGFTFTINEQNVRATTASPWGTNATCWVSKKGGSGSSGLC